MKAPSSTTLAGVTTDQIKAILTIAQNLQRNYNVLNAASTQNVRNPLPMRTLILAFAPRSAVKAVTRQELISKIRATGYAVGYAHFIGTLALLIKGGVLLSDAPSAYTKRAKFYMAA